MFFWIRSLTNTWSSIGPAASKPVVWLFVTKLSSPPGSMKAACMYIYTWPTAWPTWLAYLMFIIQNTGVIDKRKQCRGLFRLRYWKQSKRSCPSLDRSTVKIRIWGKGALIKLRVKFVHEIVDASHCVQTGCARWQGSSCLILTIMTLSRWSRQWAL